MLCVWLPAIVLIGLVCNTAFNWWWADLGWFGPRGLASIVFGVVVVEASGLPHTSELVVALTVTVALSVVAHGTTAAALARRYAAWHARSLSPMESAPAPRQRSRHPIPFTRAR